MGLVAFIMAYALFAFIFYILQVIAYWKIFTKAGEEGWNFWVALGLAVGGGILNSFGGIVGVIGSLALLGTALMNVVALYKLACAYGHGIGFTIGLFFLNPLFMLILGFGDSEYMGPQE